MKNNINKSLAILLLLCFLAPIQTSANETGTIIANNNKAWGEQTGWVNFTCSECNIKVQDRKLTGKAKSEKLGWLNLSPIENFGVKNDRRGNLTGASWGAETGWVDWRDVRINSQGLFNGTAQGIMSGTIYFNCTGESFCGGANFQLKTNWVDQGARPECSNSIDDDRDGKIDFPEDTGCSSASDNNETDNVSSSGNYNFKKSLREGDRNSDVKSLQQFLNKNGFPITSSGSGSLGKETKKFGPSTKAALIRFQNHYKAQVLTPSGLSRGTGFFGPSTIKFVNSFNSNSGNTSPSYNSSFKFTKSLNLGDNNTDVKKLQQFLNNNGFTVTTSGSGSKGKETNRFGPATKAAVIKLQNKYKSEILTPAGLSRGTGKFGPSTIKFVNNFKKTVTNPSTGKNISSNFTRDLAINMTGEDVKRLQQLLASDTSLYPEKITNGNFGPLTKKAVQKFQLKYSIITASHPAYGYVGPSTRKKLSEVF